MPLCWVELLTSVCASPAYNLLPAAARAKGSRGVRGLGSFHPWCCLGERAAGAQERKEELFRK